MKSKLAITLLLSAILTSGISSDSSCSVQAATLSANQNQTTKVVAKVASNIKKEKKPIAHKASPAPVKKQLAKKVGAKKVEQKMPQSTEELSLKD